MGVDKRRVRQLSEAKVQDGPVVYVMARDQRVEDNWALHYAAEQAHALDTTLIVLFVVGPNFAHGSARHNEWLIASLQAVKVDLQKHDIPFFVRCGDWTEVIPEFVASQAVGQLVFDFNPLEPVRRWRQDVAQALSIPVYEVDARNIIPCWHASHKTEFAARTFRPKVHRILHEFLTPYPIFPALVTPSISAPEIDWESVRAYRQCDYTELIPGTFIPGSAAAQEVLTDFLENRLAGYEKHRNDPTQSWVSDLSPYLRWGNISAQTVALAVQAASVPGDDKRAFLEELIVRRELADNYVYYTEGYDTLAGAHTWAQKTLEAHRNDPRSYLYSYNELEKANTHDDLWNAMQIQMVKEGKMHGWCRMYWAKKILEWTSSPEDAIKIALALNDHYELDGRDSNGVTGVMWAIAGVHDRAWAERPIFGKIRYMNCNGARRKFSVSDYIARYNPQTHSLL